MKTATTHKTKDDTGRARRRDGWRQVNRVQLAQLIGCHPDTITDYARLGMPVTTRGGRGKESAYDAVLCLDWWRANNGQDAKDVAQTRNFEALAQLKELELAAQRKELVPREQVVSEGRGYTKAWAAKVRALPRRLTQAGLIRREQEASVAKCCTDLLREIAAWKTPADTKRAAREADAA